MRRAVSAFLGVMLCLLASPSQAETRALLIGAATYDPGLGIPDLKGPPNDMRLLQSTLFARGVVDIRVLADGVAGASRPTHAAILEALADLAGDSQTGDLVFIALSGHGTQQPDLNGDEGDGLDEVFLPSDITRGAPGARQIPNALVDDELGAAVLAIRARGADVVLVLDSCHSGSGLRDASADQAARYVDPALLGISATARGRADAGLVEGGAAPGKFVAFYAARSSEVAREVNMTPDQPGDAGWYGLLTARLAARLAEADGLSWRQLFQVVLADLNDTALPGGGPLQTPSWEGDLIDAAVWGGATPAVRQFAVDHDRLSAGMVQGFGVGTLFALVDGDQVLGQAQIEVAEPVHSYLRPVAEDCQPREGALCPVAGVLPDARFARLLARPVDLTLQLSQPDLPADHPLLLALQAAVAEVNAAGQMQVVLGQGAEVEVAAVQERLWFGRRVLVGTTPAGLSWAPGDPVELASLITRIAAAERLAALLTSAAGEASALSPSPVAVAGDLTASRLADLDPVATGDPVRECRRAIAGAGEARAVDLAAALELKQCDLLRLTVQGDAAGALDVNRVHIDSQFCVHAAHEHLDGSGPVPLGEPMVICSDCPGGVAAGDERLFVVVTQSEDNAEQVNLEGLVETCDAAPTRSGAQAMDFLTALAARPDLRGSFGGLALRQIWVDAYAWQVLPRDEAFARQAE
jgi:hypothetical protein